jgi:transposase
LLAAAFAADAPPWLRAIPAVETLRRAWIQHYRRDDTGVHWRASGDLPPAAIFISSPHDDEAHYARKRSTQWVGYNVHVTETCDDDGPHLITHVETTAGPADDGAATPRIHQSLKDRDLLPSVHLVDTGFLDAELLVTSRDEYGVELLGPVRGDHRRQARAGEGFDAQHFQIDWDNQRATCPAGRTSISGTPTIDNRTNAVITIKCSSTDRRHCASLTQCCRSATKYPRRTITVRPQARHAALLAARAHQETATFAKSDAARAGIEGTISRGVRTCAMRRTRYIGRARTHLGHVFTATALNFLRLGERLTDQPRARSRRSAFTRLMAASQAA